ncbi:MAG TPA: 2-phospho-L-lactate guanylyltransferase [Solirubrobacteraceae bacterium]|jgi:2-phospho-L-lactate guanylyltransferase
MRTFAVLPVKRFGVAKQRLRGGLDPATREALVEAMFTDVVDSLLRAPVERIVVVTASAAARTIAADRGAEVVADRELGHNAAAELGIDVAVRGGAQQVLLVPGDCPALDPQELAGLLRRSVQPPSVIVVPDRHGTGTNALLLSPPDALAPSFGPGSAQRHLELARARGTDAQLVELPSLALDIDTPEDIESLTKVSDGRARLTLRLLSQPSAC